MSGASRDRSKWLTILAAVAPVASVAPTRRLSRVQVAASRAKTTLSLQEETTDLAHRASFTVPKGLNLETSPAHRNYARL